MPGGCEAMEGPDAPAHIIRFSIHNVRRRTYTVRCRRMRSKSSIDGWIPGSRKSHQPEGFPSSVPFHWCARTAYSLTRCLPRLFTEKKNQYDQSQQIVRDVIIWEQSAVVFLFFVAGRNLSALSRIKYILTWKCLWRLKSWRRTISC